MHPGQGPGLSLYDLGETSGSSTITLLTSEIPVHAHTMRSINDVGDINVPTNNGIARSTGAAVFAASGPVVQLSPLALAPAGGDLPHNNRQPYLGLNFCIALQGIYPPRT